MSDLSTRRAPRRTLVRAAAAIACASLLAAPSIASAAPNHLTLQGYLAESGGTPATGDYTIVLALYDGALAPTAFWEESHTVTVFDGLFDAVLGGDAINPLTVADFVDNDEVWLGVTVIDGPGVPDGGEAELPRRQLSSTGFAFAAGHADTAETASHAATADAASHATTATSATSAATLTCSGCVTVAQLSFDPATQAELDAAIAALDVPTSVHGLGGGTITGGVTVTGIVEATSFVLSGGATVCTSEGGCGPTLGDLTCVPPNDVPVYDHNQGAWKCSAGTASGGTVATDLSCSGCVDPNELSFEVVTPSGLTVALADYVTSTGLSSALAEYVTQSALDTTLGAYATVASLAAYATMADLESYALVDEVPTSVDGLGGGEIAGSVTVDGTLAATEVRQNGNVVCDASGNCGQTLAGLNCTTNQTIRFEGGQWACADAETGGGGSPGIECTGDYKVLQWDGSAWQCKDLRATGLSAGGANGWEIVDDWGDAWDAIERPPAPWEEALDDCVAEGGRLPTVTELWRNRASTGGTGNFADVTATRYLWAYNYDVSEPNHETVRLSDGSISASGPTSNVNYRCVWPKHQSDVFDGSHCFGPPGAECAERGRAFHVDRYSRPAVDAASAAWECRFHNASLMDMRAFQEIVQGVGFDHNVYDWHWLSDFAYWYNNNDGYHMARSAEGQNVHWGFDNGTNGWGDEGNLSAEGGPRRFRCVGRKATDIGVLPTPACVDDDCFTLTKRNGILVADAVDRPALKRQQAVADCRADGGDLPTTVEFFDLVQSGWDNGSNSWLWLDEIEYFYNNGYYYGLGRWTGAGVPGWALNNNSITGGDENTAYAYRCVWRERFEDTMTQCAPHQNQMWDGSTFTCVDAVDGTVSDAVSWPAGFPAFADAWGNRWDFFQRNDTMNYATAKSTCESLGGRLPTASELWRVRYQQGVVGSELGQSTDTSWLWTMTPSAAPNYMIRLRLGDGATDHADASNANTLYNVRCIWPTTKGDAFGGRSCYGDPDDADGGCFEHAAGGLRIDAYDRPAVYPASAAWECAYYGGRLPNALEYEDLIHAGLANGTEQWLHVASPVYWYSGGYGTELLRFRDTDGVDWAWSYGVAALSNYRTGSLQWETSRSHFRCIYSNRLD